MSYIPPGSAIGGVQSFVPDANGNPTPAVSAVANPAGGAGVAVQAVGLAGLLSLNAASATGAGTALDGGVCHSHHTMVVTSGPGVSAGSVQLQGSLDGVAWFNLGSAVSTSSASTTFAPVVVSSQPVRSLRADIATTITGGTVSAVVATSG